MRKQTWLVCWIVLTGASGLWAEPVTLTGTVLGPDGKPVAGAQVLTIRVADKAYNITMVEATTEADGAFSLANDDANWSGRTDMPVLARKAGLALVIGLIAPGKPATLTLGDKPETRSGVVLTPEGKPVVGAAVTVSNVFDAAEDGGGVPRRYFFFGTGAEWKTVTDEQGRFSFEGVGADLMLLAGLSVDGYASAQVQLPTEKPVTVSLKPEARVSGRVLLSGKPAEGLVVLGWAERGGGGSTAKTAADGTYTLSHLTPGAARVTVRPGDGYAAPPQRSVTLTAGQTATGVDFSVTPGGIIKGKVTSTVDGKPLPGAYVMAHPVAGGTNLPGAPTTCGLDGSYQLRLMPGSYRLSCQVAGASSPANEEQAEVVVVTEGGVMEGKDFALKPPRKVSGQVLLPDGKPAAEARLTLFSQYRSNENLPVSPEGKFELVIPEPFQAPKNMPAPPPMPSVLIARDLPSNSCLILPLEKLTEQPTITLQPGASVTVPVVDMQGKPLPGVRVTADLNMEHYGFGIAQAKTGDDGLARLVGLPAGWALSFQIDYEMSHLIVRDPQAPAMPRGPQTLGAGEERKLPPIFINPEGRSLNVFVGDAEGKPVRGALVYAEHIREPFVTDEQGKVTLTKLAVEGKVSLLAAHPTQALFAAATVDPDKDPWPGLLLAPPGEATGQLIQKPGGKPLAGAAYSCEPHRGLWWLGQDLRERIGLGEYRTELLKTDTDGRWQAKGLIAGQEYVLFAGYTVATENRREGGQYVGTFTATGGPEVQDIGVREVNERGAGKPPPPPGQ